MHVILNCIEVLHKSIASLTSLGSFNGVHKKNRTDYLKMLSSRSKKCNLDHWSNLSQYCKNGACYKQCLHETQIYEVAYELSVYLMTLDGT